MSADNAYFVIHSEKDGRHIYAVTHGYMSPFVECGAEHDPESEYLKLLYLKGKKFTDFLNSPVEARKAALLYAHDTAREEPVLEYGVIEVELEAPTAEIHHWASVKEAEQEEIRKEIAKIREEGKGKI